MSEAPNFLCFPTTHNRRHAPGLDTECDLITDKATPRSVEALIQLITRFSNPQENGHA